MSELIGRTLGQYRIIEQIGEGGMATVYRAYQPNLNRYVALKVLPPIHAKQPGFSERFRREAEAVANLNHPNILPVFDFGQEQGYSFIAMRYVEGARTLKEVMASPLSLAQVADLIGQIAAALDYAHRQGVIHRDVKPSNVLMDGDWALLGDFGLAKMTETSVKLTGSGVGVGTPAYMSPEQGQGLEVDRRTDVYSLGIVLFEILTGQIPHNAETPLAIVLRRINEPLPLPRAINPDIPEAVERVILKTLARDPADRFASAGEMADALEQAVGQTAADQPEARPVAKPEPIIARPPEAPPSAMGQTPLPGTARLVSPWKWVAAIGGAAAVVVLCIAGLLIAPQVWRLVVATLSPASGPIAVGSTPMPTATLTMPVTTNTPEATPLPTPALTGTPRLPIEASTPVATQISGVDDAAMVYVPAGEFWMGSTDADIDAILAACDDCEQAWYEAERPQREVYPDAFWIDQTEVTNAQYASFLTERGNQEEGGVAWLNMEWAPIERTDSEYRAKSGYEHRPVVNVTWYGAKAYCEWAGRQLPTEAEWEKAARGDDKRTYPWGRDINCDHANYAECVSGSTEVGSYLAGASPYGALDMAGNVWEWAADWYDKDHYKIPVVPNPQGPQSGDYRVLRGGSTALDAVHARAANRGWSNPDASSSDVGFRCAASAAVTPTPTSTAVTTQTPEVDDAVMVHVPAGEFWMGSTEQDIDAVIAECNDCEREQLTDEQPQHKVYVDAFWIDQTEVTNAQYQKCVDAGACMPPSSFESDKEPNYYGNPAYGDYPVIWVNWTQADAYCHWAGKRLPTEAEWEKAARGDDKRRYPWGEEDIGCDRANFWDKKGVCVHDTAKVGSYPAGASFYGALDMAGNVWEWVADWYDENYYQVSPERNPPGPDFGKARVMRGGSWINSRPNARAPNRERGTVNHSTRYIGFRCAYSLP